MRTKKATASGSVPFTWDRAAPLPELIGDGSTAYITGPGGLPLEQVTATGSVHYYHKDQLGSMRAITDSTGAVSASYAFDPYGNPTAKTGSLTNPFGYAGQYTDPESDMQYLRARYYDPATLNFITRDPLASSTRAPYDYAADSPTNNIDPTGLGCSATTQAGGRGAGGVTTAPAEAPGLPADMFATGGAAGGQSATGQNAPAAQATRPGELPATGAPPNSTGVRDIGRGRGQIRDYDDEGRAKRDFDFGHDHGAGDPHAHDWDWDKRHPRDRPIGPGE